MPITVIDGRDTCCEIALRRMSLDLTDDKSILVQVMAWCRQATSHYLSQCWPTPVPLGHDELVYIYISISSTYTFHFYISKQITVTINEKNKQKNTKIHLPDL